jgi:two-component system, NarL family, nitrate/nitrite response regulator NarL
MRILVIDDHAVLRHGLALVIRESFPQAEVVEASPGGEVRFVMEASEVDAVLFDARLRTPGGLELLHELKARWPTVPLVVVATFDPDYALQALAQGAAGYLLEDAAPADLVQAIEVAVAGGNVLSSGIVRNLFHEPGDGEPSEARHASAPRLTLRETGILALLAEGMSNRDISRTLFVSEKTVKAHLAAIFRKLGLSNRTQAAMAAVSMGIRPTPERASTWAPSDRVAAVAADGEPTHSP